MLNLKVQFSKCQSLTAFFPSMFSNIHSDRLLKKKKTNIDFPPMYEEILVICS